MGATFLAMVAGCGGRSPTGSIPWPLAPEVERHGAERYLVSGVSEGQDMVSSRELPETGDSELPVLIVGGGPAGLTAALELARRGVRGLLVERRDFSAHFPRAHLLNVRTMETFADIGVAEAIYAEAPPDDQWHRVAWYTSLAGPTSAHGKRIGFLQAWGGGSDAIRYARASPRRFANLSQRRVDRLLWEQADRQWPGRIRARTELVDLTMVDGAAVATLRDLTADRDYQVRSRFVVVADGGRTCSALLGIETTGPRALFDLVTVFFSADLKDHADPEALLTQFIQPEGGGGRVGTLLALGPGRWGAASPQWSFTIINPDSRVSRDRSALCDRVRSILGIPDLDLEVHSVSHWRYEGVVADRFRVGPAFLVGDAAHRHPPSGGLGLNTAVGDAANLAWKLAAVLSGTASDSLLDSYESERRQIALHNVEHALRNAGRHAPIGSAMGLRKGMTAEQGWAELAVWASATPEGERRRLATTAAVRRNAENYSQLNIEAGFCYEKGAIIPDGTPPPDNAHSPTDFVPSARPGQHIPHVWLWAQDGTANSTSDLVAPEGLTLFVDVSHASDWQRAARTAAVQTGCPLDTVVINGPDTADRARNWPRVSGVDSSGAVLVRPDRHVAWRTFWAPSDQVVTLTQVINRLMKDGAPSRQNELEPVPKAIIEAGEALRLDHPYELGCLGPRGGGGRHRERPTAHCPS